MDHTYVVYYEHISEQYEYPLARVPLTTSFYTNQQRCNTPATYTLPI